MKALIIGATGATGKNLVSVILADPDYTELVIFVRRSSGIKHSKLSEIITDFDKLESVSDDIKGDVLFSCLGTTLKAAGSKERQWHIDYEIPLRFAEIAKRNGIRKLVLLSAYGASATSKMFYSRIKGQLEKSLGGIAFDTYIIFRPGVLLRVDSDRAGERITVKLLGFLNTFGIIRKFRSMPATLLAEKLAIAPRVFGKGEHIVQLDKIFDLHN